MYSQCPDCQTRFRVTAATLRAAHGTVRCGRCGSAFDALERLSDTIPPPIADASPVPIMLAAEQATAPGPTLETEFEFTADDLERVFVDDRAWRASIAIADQQPAHELEGIGAEPPLVLVEEDAGVENITLEGERVAIEESAEPAPTERDVESTDELEILRDVPDSAYPDDEGEADLAREIAALAAQFRHTPEQVEETGATVAGAVEYEDESQSGAAREAVPTGDVEPVVAPGAPHAEPIVTAVGEDSPPEEVVAPKPLSAQRWRQPVEDSEPEPPDAGSRWGTLAWSTGGLLLAVALAAQLIHYFRQDLVRHPQAGPPLRAAYEKLGMPLLPNWDLAAFELRQWGNDAGAAAQGRMAVRASLTNRAAFAQPHPILRLELEDRFGGTVATRDFEPSDYLKNPSQATRLIAPGSSSEAELLLADPGPEAVGYRLDVCLRESASLLRCARGPG